MSSSAINQAIRNCSSAGGGIVQLGPGTFYLSDSIGFFTSGVVSKNVTLRGAGPDQTQLIFTGAGPGTDGVVCGVSDGLICISDSVISTAQCNQGTASRNTANWIANYTAGSTQIVFDNVSGNSGNHPVALTAGMYLLLDQADSPGSEFSQYVPFATSDPNYAAYVCSGNRNGRCVAEFHKVTNVQSNTPNVGQHTITITPPLSYQYWQSAKSPGAWWCASVAETLTGNGVEDLSIDNQTGDDNTQNFRGLITFGNAHESWVKNVRAIRSGGAYVYGFFASNIEVRDSYFYTNVHPTLCANPAGTVTYGMDPNIAGWWKVENNIFHQTCKALMAQACWVCVFGYNFTVGDLPQVDSNGVPHTNTSSAPNHVAASHGLLWEGNVGTGITQDHGTGHGAGVGLFTAFRNYMSGVQTANPLGGQVPTPICPVCIGATNRFSNYIGNVLGDPSIASWAYQTSPVTGGNTLDLVGFIYSIGWSRLPAQNPDDTITYTSLMRWGNFDYVTNSVRWDRDEVPPDNPVPATHNLPASFYLSARPAWFGNAEWPAIGPDVTGGTDPAGHAADIPAKRCYLNVMAGPADGSGAVLAFNVNSC